MKREREETNTDPCISTVDRSGISYGERLKRARESTGKSPQEVAAMLGVSFQEYYEWEHFEAELNMAMSLGELSKLATVLGTRTRSIFDDENQKLPSLSPEQLSMKIKEHLSTTGTSVAAFEDRVGFVVEPALRDPSEVLKWNVDCLRFVCREIGADWLTALQ